MTAELYQASPIRRTRATKAEVAARREALLDIIEAGRPMKVRQMRAAAGEPWRPQPLSGALRCPASRVLAFFVGSFARCGRALTLHKPYSMDRADLGRAAPTSQGNTPFVTARCWCRPFLGGEDAFSPQRQPCAVFLSGRMDRWTCDLDCEPAQLGVGCSRAH